MAGSLTNSPSVEIVRAAQEPRIVKDAKGRSIGIKKMGVLDRMRLFEVVGAENVKNEAYLGYASLAFLVASIDGDPVSRPATKRELEAIVQRLDEDGLQAVANGAVDLMSAEVTSDEVKVAVKNG